MKKEVLKEKAVLIVGKLLKKEVDRKISDEWPPGCAALFYQPIITSIINSLEDLL